MGVPSLTMTGLQGMKGPELLRGYCKEKELTYAMVGSVLDCAEQTIAQWASGQTRPRLVMRLALRELASIEPDEWVSADERMLVEKLVADIRRLRTAPEVKLPSLQDKVAGRI